VTGPLQELTVLVPERLTSTGEGLLSFVVQVENLNSRRYTARCFVELPGGGAGTRLGAAVGVDGQANLVFPGHLHGQTLVRLDLFDRERGRRLTGAFTLMVRHSASTGNIVINAGDRQVSGNAVNYQPIEVRGVERKAVETVGDRVRVHVPLRQERLQDAVPLGELVGKERILVLSNEAPIRVLDIHVGQRLVVGRCYARDIRKERAAWDRLRKACPSDGPRVDWVTAWDDARLNRLLAVLELETAPEGHVLHVENPTDYSRRASRALGVSVEGGELEMIAAGERGSVAVGGEEEIVIAADCAVRPQEFLRFTVEEVEAGGAIIPVIRTIRSRFRWPPVPEDGGDGDEIRFLGLWIPRSSRELERILRPSNSRLWVSFPEEEALGLEIDWSRRYRSLAVAGTVNLRACMDRG